MLNEGTIIYNMWKNVMRAASFTNCRWSNFGQKIMSSLEYLWVQLYIMTATYIQ